MILNVRKYVYSWDLALWICNQYAFPWFYLPLEPFRSYSKVILSDMEKI